jgi:tRNA (cytidine/uridine-2'-O-)-methyltransferase
LASLNIVLAQPEIPQNTGNIARTCAATGANLHLIKPLGFQIDDRKLKRAGLDYWWMLNITYYENFEDFFTRNSGSYYFFSTKAARIYSNVQYEDGSFLIFGRETAGLPETLLAQNYEKTVRIPMKDDARSLNLSNSVAIGVFEVLRQWGFVDLKTKGVLNI